MIKITRHCNRIYNKKNLILTHSEEGLLSSSNDPFVDLRIPCLDTSKHSPSLLSLNIISFIRATSMLSFNLI